MVIGYPAGGANDRYARTMARHIGKYIPGQPTVISRNMPGGGSLLAANHVFHIAPKDGTVISLLAATIPLEEALGTQGALFKSAQFNWIGRMASSVNITFTNANAPVKTIKDAFTHEAILGGTGRSGTPTVYPSVLNNVLGMKFKIVMGYSGSVAAMLAMERGEIEGHSTSIDGVKAARQDWLTDKKIKFSSNMACDGIRNFRTCRSRSSSAARPRRSRSCASSPTPPRSANMTLAPPGVPADRVQALRRAFEADDQGPRLSRGDAQAASGDHSAARRGAPEDRRRSRHHFACDPRQGEGDLSAE